MATTYKIRLKNEAEGIDQTVDVPDDAYILETAEAEGWSYRFPVVRACVLPVLESW